MKKGTFATNGTVMNHLSDAESFDLGHPTLFSPPKLDQKKFKRVSRTEDTSPYPIAGLSADILHMQVKEGSKIRNILRFAEARMQEGNLSNGAKPHRQVVFTGSGRSVTKTITCVEILKRQLQGLQQVSKLYSKTVIEVWESLQHGGPQITTHRMIPSISILLSKDPLNPQEPGYQPPQDMDTLLETRRSLGTGIAILPHITH